MAAHSLLVILDGLKTIKPHIKRVKTVKTITPHPPGHNKWALDVVHTTLGSPGLLAKPGLQGLVKVYQSEASLISAGMMLQKEELLPRLSFFWDLPAVPL